MTVKEMWERYRKEAGISEDTPYDSWHFCNNEKDANELAELTKKGIKRGTAGMLKSYEADDEPIPKAGNYIVITDWKGKGVCIIQVEKVEVLPFGDITEEHAIIEGEGDKSLKYWREGHQKFFSQEAEELGIEFNEEIEVVFETFKVVF